MHTSYWLILGFSIQCFILLLMLGIIRISYVLQAKHGLRFQPGGEDVSALCQRISRAHANCYENLPMVIGVVLVAAMTHRLQITDPLAIVFLGFRIAQSLVHVISTSNKAIMLRFTLFLVQCGILIYWFICLAGGCVYAVV